MTFSRIAVGLLLLQSACNLIPIGGSPDLGGRSFLSTAVTVGGVDRPLVANTQIRIGFADGTLSASAGCNIFGGDYRVDGGVLVVTGGSMTEMGCDEDRGAQDEWLFALLGAQPILALSGDELTLEEGDTVISLLDREVADPDLPLVGTTWTVTSIISGDAASSIPDGVVATLVFTEDATVMVDTGCNTGSGGVDIGTNTLRFGPVALTEMACQGPAGDMESAMVPILSADVVSFAIEARSLTLTIGDQGLQLSGTP